MKSLKFMSTAPPSAFWAPSFLSHLIFKQVIAVVRVLMVFDLEQYLGSEIRGGVLSLPEKGCQIIPSLRNVVSLLFQAGIILGSKVELDGLLTKE
jgi:hypothetical protein